MSLLDLLITELKSDFSATRPFLPQVLKEVTTQHSVSVDELPQFFAEQFPELEDYQVDLLFAAQFTPTLQDKARYAKLLGSAGLSESEFADLKQTLLQENLKVGFTIVENNTEISVGLHEMFVDRYLDRLELIKTLPEDLLELIRKVLPEQEQPVAMAVCRNSLWNKAENRTILLSFLNAGNQVPIELLTFLMDVLKTYRPTHLKALSDQLDSLVQSCQRDMESVGTRGFHDEYLQSLHAHTDVNADKGQDVWAQYKRTIEQAKSLQQLLIPVSTH